MNVVVKKPVRKFTLCKAKRRQCVYCVGVKCNPCFYYVLQPVQWLALAVTTFVVVVV